MDTVKQGSSKEQNIGMRPAENGRDSALFLVLFLPAGVILIISLFYKGYIYHCDERQSNGTAYGVYANLVSGFNLFFRMIFKKLLTKSKNLNKLHR